MKFVTGKNRKVKSLVGNNSSEADKICSFFLLSAFCFLLFKKWINNGTFSIVVFLDSFLCISWVCNKNIWSLSSFYIPFFHQRKSCRDHKFCQPIQPPKFQEIFVVLTMAPEISSRRVAVAHMHSMWVDGWWLMVDGCRDMIIISSFFLLCAFPSRSEPFRVDDCFLLFYLYSFGFRRSTGNHKVVFRKIKSRKCQRTQEHTELMPLVQIRNFLNKTGLDISSGKYFWTLWEIDRSVNICFRKELHQTFKYPLRTTPMSNPVSHQRYFFLWKIHNADSIEILW